MMEVTHLSTLQPLHAVRNPRRASSDVAAQPYLEAERNEYVRLKPIQQVQPAVEPNEDVNLNMV